MTSGKLPFSQRHGAVPLKVSPDREHVPDLIRGEFAFKFLRQSSTKFQNMLYSDLRPIIWRVTGHEPPEPSGHHNFVWMSNEYETIKVILYACDWGTFYEICEIVFTRYSNTFNIAQAHEMQNEANLLFATELLAWRFEDGVIVPAYPKEITEIFEEAKGLLSDPVFSAPNEQFRKASGHMAEKPVADTENCVKDSVGALEGVAQIVAGKPNATLGDLVKKGTLKSSVPQHLLGIIEKLYVYRGNESGVAHAKTHLSTVGIDEANFVLSTCATAMTYLISKSPN